MNQNQLPPSMHHQWKEINDIPTENYKGQLLMKILIDFRVNSTLWNDL